jgi:hypothetical protein
LYHESDVGDWTDVVGLLQLELIARYSSAWAVMVTAVQVPLEQLVSDTEAEYELVSLYLRVPLPVELPALMT